MRGWCSSGSRFSSYTWSLPCPLPMAWRNAVGLAWRDILPGWWLPGLWVCSFGHASSGSREASPQTCPQKKALSGKVGQRPALPQSPNPVIGAFKHLRRTSAAGTPRPGNSTGGMIYTQPHLAGTCSCGGCQLRTAEHFPRSAAVAPVSRPTPGHYHVLYRGCGETQLGWHGETYCLVGGYRLYGDVPLATPAKVEAEKPVPRRALKRKHSPEWSDEDLCCPRPKIRRLELSGSTGIQAAAVAPVSRPTPGHYHVVYRGCGETQLGRHGETYCLVGGYRLYGDVPLATPAKVEAEKPVPIRAPKRKHCPEMSDEDLGCCGPKIRRL
uniref:Uncharacterized protein LOC109548293 isoform X4 n=1 Tax=Tursiops truncatus TaxID=9739 RepID=A0A6J3Q9W5_TURTR|nr:uncharacterized protein LOC109548293 isoform X4 [Tursiops truncatus]